MQYRELYQYTGRALRGKYPQAYAAALLYPAAWLLLKLFPCFLAAVLVACGTLSPMELFFGKLPLWVAFSVLWEVLRFCILTPIGCGMCSWFTETLGLRPERMETVFFRDVRSFCKGMWYFAVVAFRRFLALLPFVLSAACAVFTFRCSMGLADGGLWLFAFVQCLLAAFWSILYYLYFCTNLLAVPFLYLSDPDGSPWQAVRNARCLMHGSRLALLRLFLRDGLAGIPLVTIPVLLPFWMSHYTLFIQIRLREWEQENAYRF